jgi:hypothetical protein
MKPRRRFAPALIAASLAICVCTPGCGHVPRIAASGTFAGYSMSGPVDSKVARDYLEGKALPSSLAEIRRRYLAAGQVPSQEMLTAVTREYSPDVATLLLIETLSATSKSQDLRRRFDTELAYVRRVGIERARPDIPENLLVLLVPGWFYITHGNETGADFKSQRQTFERMGVANQLVALDENGTVEHNARIVASVIRQASRMNCQILLVSASKSGAEVAQALGRELSHNESASVVGWVSIGGVVRGSPIADRVLKPDLCWFTELKFGLEGFDLEGAKSMRTDRAGRAFEDLSFPAHVRIVSFLPTPLSGNITKRGGFGYACMRVLGPNDGMALLADELIPTGTPFLAVGVDHFLEDADRDLWTAAMFRVLMKSLKPELAMRCPESIATRRVH